MNPAPGILARLPGTLIRLARSAPRVASKDRTPNDDSADSQNPNNPAYRASEKNRARQLVENDED